MVQNEILKMLLILVILILHAKTNARTRKTFMQLFNHYILKNIHFKISKFEESHTPVYSVLQRHVTPSSKTSQTRSVYSSCFYEANISLV